MLPVLHVPSASEIEDALVELGASRVVWLKGDREEKITSGHADGYVLPSESGDILVQRADTKDRSAKLRNSDIETLQTLHATNGNAIRVRLVSPPRIVEGRSEFFADSYLNIYSPNSAVIAPPFNDKFRDAKARLALEEAFPGREIEMLSVPHLASGGGGIRRLVQPVPASDAVRE
jgi:agmatine deiminase